MPEEKKTSSDVELDKVKFNLEKWRVEEDLKLRREELDLKQKDLSKSRWSSPLLIAIVGLFTTVTLNIVQNIYQNASTSELERQRFESNLIQKALESPSKDLAKQRFQSYLDLGLLRDAKIKEQIQKYVNQPDTIPLNIRDEDVFSGTTRSDAKTSIGSGPLTTFADLKDLRESLPADESMVSRAPENANSSNSGRTAEEQRNVRVSGFLYAAKKNASNDYALVIGRAPNAQPPEYMLMYVSGLPAGSASTLGQLKVVRDTFEELYRQRLGQSLPGDSYSFLERPIQVNIEGSLYFDFARAKGVKPGPTRFLSYMNTSWQVRPITHIEFK
jgi:hypothetical protein